MTVETTNYTDADLRAAAAHWLRLVNTDKDFADYGQPLFDQKIPSNTNGQTWGDLFDTNESAYTQVEETVIALMREAPPLTQYAVELGAENLTPGRYFVYRGPESGEAFAAVHVALGEGIRDKSAVAEAIQAAVRSTLGLKSA